MNPHTIPVRLSHLLRHCTVGAIVRGDKHLMVVNDTRSWFRPECEPPPIQYVDRVRKALHISQRLCLPPISTVTDQGDVENWIAATLFPGWTHCPSCGLLHNRPWRHWDSDDPWICSDPSCRKELEQVPWILVHEEGYLADLPLHGIAHAQRPEDDQSCRPDWNVPYLRLVEGERGRIVTCTRCQASSALPDRFPYPAGASQQPWLFQQPAGPLEELGWILSINDVRVHTSNTKTALVIPPESRIHKGTVEDRLYCNTGWQQELQNATTPLQRKATFKRIARTCGCDSDRLEQAWEEIKKGYPYYGDLVSGDDLLGDEYEALIHPFSDLSEDEDFVTEHHTDGWKAMGRTTAGTPRQAITAVNRLIEVRRLKEVLVLHGFTRIGTEMTNVPPDITHETGWLPALELYGEGIFFTLDEELLGRWEQQPALRAHTAKLKRRLAGVRVPALQTELTPRFLLLHTLAHLIIRNLEIEAGYPAASLKERIYCEIGERPMAGVLIYVAVPDEVGSLGGLGEVASPGRFLRVLTRAFDAASWCSLDPVCGTQDGRGPHLLNRAACHACVLIPESSCLFGNILLDRTFVKRDPEARIASLLDFAGDTS